MNNKNYLNKKTPYTEVYKNYKMKMINSSSSYKKIFDNYIHNYGLDFLVTSPSSSVDRDLVTTPFPQLSNALTNASFTVNGFDEDTWFNTSFNDFQIIWGQDQWYSFTFENNSNLFRIGFYADNSPLSEFNLTSTNPPTFYYDSLTGNIIMGGTIKKKIIANTNKLVIRIDSLFNFYVGITKSSYYLIGNCLDYMSAININSYSIRWGFEIQSKNANNPTIFNIDESGWTNINEIPSANTIGVTFPNYRIVAQPNSPSISSTLLANSNHYKVYDVLNKSNVLIEYGTPTSFTLKCISGTIDQVIVCISNSDISQQTFLRYEDLITALGSYVLYDSLTNEYINNTNSVIPPSFPNITNASGQIYFNINGNDVSSSRDLGSAISVGNITISSGSVYIYVITKSFDSAEESGVYSFIANNSLSNLSNPVEDPSVITSQLIGYTQFTSLPSGVGETFSNTSALTYYTTSYENPSSIITYGVDQYWYVNFLNSDCTIKIGFYTDSSSWSNNVSSSSTPPQFYYDSATGNCHMGVNIVKVIKPNLLSIMVRVDENGDFYVGESTQYYYKMDNILSYFTNINQNTYSIRLGWEVFSQNGGGSFNISLIEGGVKEPVNYSPSYPNTRLYNSIVSDFCINSEMVNNANVYNAFPLYNYSNKFALTGNYTLQCQSDVLVSNLYVVIYSSNIYSPNATYNTLNDALGATYLCYDALQDVFIQNSVANFTVAGMSFPDLMSGSGQIYVEITNDSVYVGADSSHKQFVTLLPVLSTYSSCLLSYGTSSNLFFNFIPTNVKDFTTNPNPYPPQVSLPQEPSSGYTSVELNTFTKIPSPITCSPDVEYVSLAPYNTSYTETNFKFGSYYLMYITITSTFNNYKIGFINVSTTDDKINTSQGLYVNTDNEDFLGYYDSTDGGLYLNGVAINYIEPNLQNILVCVDENGVFYVGKNPSLTFSVGNLQTEFINQSYGSKSVYTPLCGIIFNSSTTNFTYAINSGSVNVYPTSGVSYPNMLIEVDTLLHTYALESSLMSSSNNQFTAYKIGGLIHANNPDFQHYTITCQVPANDVILVIATFDSQIISGQLYPASFFSSSTGTLWWRQTSGSARLGGTSLTTYTGNLLDVDGYVYLEYNTDNKIYIGTNSVDKTLLTQLAPQVNGYYAYFLARTNNESTTCSYKMSIDNVNTGPSEPPTVVPSLSAPTASGNYTYYSAQIEYNGKWNKIYYGMTPDQETLFVEDVTYYQAWAHGWQSTLVFDFTIPNYKIGVGLVCTTPVRVIGISSGFNVNPIRQWSTTDYYLYYYYDSSNGYIYKNNEAVYAIQPGLSTVGFAIDEVSDVYLVTSTLYYYIGSYLDYYQNGINHQTGIHYGIVATPTISTFTATESYTVNNSKTNIYMRISDSYFKFDNIYNKLLYDQISGKYKPSITASSTTNYKYIECQYNHGRPVLPNCDRFMFEFTIAPQDVVLLFGYEQIVDYTPGAEYTLLDIQTPFLTNTPTYTYVQSTASFYASTTLRNGYNLGLNQNGKKIYVDQIEGADFFNWGANYATRIPVAINRNVAPFTTSSNAFLNFIGFFIKTSSPSTFCQISMIDIE